MKRFAVVLVVLVILFASFSLINRGEKKGSSSETAALPGSHTVSPDNLVVETNGIQVAFSPYDIDGEYTLDVSTTEPQPLDGESEIGKDYQIAMFDLVLDGKSDFDDAIEIVIPYDDTFIDTGSVEADSVAAVWFNQETNGYESELYTVDTGKNEVTIYTSHLSQHGVVVFRSSYAYGPFTVDKEREYTRSARIIDVNTYRKVVNSATAQDVVQGLIENDLAPDGKALQAGFNEANTWLGLTATGNTIVGSAFSSAFLTELTNAFNLVGVGASLVQVGVDFQNGDDQALLTNLLKNGVYNTVNYAGWGSLQLSFAGVFFIDYSLNTFATEAFDGSAAKWKDAYDLCYDKYYKRSAAEWRRTISETVLPKMKDPGRLGDVMEAAVYNQTLQVWDDPHLSDCVDEAGYTGFDALGGFAAAPKTQIAMAKKAEVFNTMRKTVFFRLGEARNRANRAEYQRNLEKVRNMLNQEADLTINGASQYEGYSVRFASLNAKANADSWMGVIDSSGTFHTRFTYLGYLESGSPRRAEIVNPANGQVLETIALGEIAPIMSFTIGDTSKTSTSGTDKSVVDKSETSETDVSAGKWVLYEKRLIDGCSFYESECYALESCSAGEGSYQIGIGFSTCSCETCGGDSGSGSYTVPPDVLTPGETIPFAATAEGDGSTSVDFCFYVADNGMTSDQVIIGEDGTNEGISPGSCGTIVENSSPAADWTVDPDWNHQGVIMIVGGGSIGSFETSMRYYYLYKWQE